MGDDGGCFIIPMIGLALVFIGFVSGIGVTKSVVESVRTEAVDRGFAKYVADNKGHTTFVWEEPTSEK